MLRKDEGLEEGFLPPNEVLSFMKKVKASVPSISVITKTSKMRWRRLCRFICCRNDLDFDILLS